MVSIVGVPLYLMSTVGSIWLMQFGQQRVLANSAAAISLRRSDC
jgi:hypothetical protein